MVLGQTGADVDEAARQDILFVDGLTGSVDFHLDALLKLSWPAAKLTPPHVRLPEARATGR